MTESLFQVERRDGMWLYQDRKTWGPDRDQADTMTLADADAWEEAHWTGRKNELLSIPADSEAHRIFPGTWEPSCELPAQHDGECRMLEDAEREAWAVDGADLPREYFPCSKKDPDRVKRTEQCRVTTEELIGAMFAVLQRGKERGLTQRDLRAAVRHAKSYLLGPKPIYVWGWSGGRAKRAAHRAG